MNIDRSLLAFIVLIGAVIAGRFIGEAGLKALSAEQKGQLIEQTTAIRKYGLIVLLVLMFVVWNKPPLMAAAAFLYILGSYGFYFYKVRQLALPATYVKSFAASMAVSLLGVVGFFIVLGMKTT
jgi:hypothetical protein